MDENIFSINRAFYWSVLTVQVVGVKDGGEGRIRRVNGRARRYSSKGGSASRLEIGEERHLNSAAVVYLIVKSN